jgi:hypothetical protein
VAVTPHLLLLVSTRGADLEVAELVGVLRRGDDVKEITELLLLQVLLGEVLEVSLRERKLGGDADLGLVAGDGNLLTEVAGLAVDLDSIVEELLEGSNIEYLVLNRGGTIDGELGNGLLAGLLDGLLRFREKAQVES